MSSTCSASANSSRPRHCPADDAADWAIEAARIGCGWTQALGQADKIPIFRAHGLHQLRPGASLLSQVDAHDNILIIVAEAATKDIDAARMAGRFVDPDP